MAVAPPPAAFATAFAPRVSGELAEVAERYGMSHLVAAALDRLGIDLLA